MPSPADTQPVCSVNDRHPLHDERTTWTTCAACEDWIRDRLDDIERLWPQLPDYLERDRGHASPRVSGNTVASAPLPLAENTLTLIAPGGAHDRLAHHDTAIRQARGLHGAPTLGTADHRMKWTLHNLRTHLDWAAQHVDLLPLATELRQLVSEMRAVTNPTSTPTTIALNAPCTVTLDEGTECGGTLRYHREHRTTRCDNCGTHLDMSTWRQAVGLY